MSIEKHFERVDTTKELLTKAQNETEENEARRILQKLKDEEANLEI